MDKSVLNKFCFKIEIHLTLMRRVITSFSQTTISKQWDSLSRDIEQYPNNNCLTTKENTVFGTIKIIVLLELFFYVLKMYANNPNL